MERLARRLRDLGAAADVYGEYAPSAWRDLMARGKLGRLAARARSMLVYPARAVISVIVGDDDFVIPTTNPFFLPWLLVATRPMHGRRVVPLIYDLYPDALEAAGMACGAASPLRRIAEAMNRALFRAADGVVFIGARMAEHASERYGAPRRAIVLETGADAEEFRPSNLGAPAPESELERWCEGKTVAAYVGNFGLMHDWRTLAEAVPRALEPERERGSLAVLIAASGPGVEHLREAWKGLPAERVRFEPPLEDRAWARLLPRCAISLTTLADAAEATCVPSKAFSAMAAGSAILAVAPSRSDLAALVRRHDCGAVVSPGEAGELAAILARWSTNPGELAELRARSALAHAEHYDLRPLARRWLEFLHELDAAPAEARAVYESTKRAIELTGTALGLVVISPLLLGASVAVLASMGRPVLFRQDRPGLGGKPFRLMKFRTMRAARPGEEGPEFDAARLTRVGRFLRATSIDELPALFNVLRGDLSLVGPRPLLTRYLPRYSPRQARRHEVKPGITGWAQTHGRNSISWEEKFELDVWYVDHRSLLVDAKILLSTLLKVVRRDGISQEGHATMPEFLGSPATRERA